MLVHLQSKQKSKTLNHYKPDGGGNRKTKALASPKKKRHKAMSKGNQKKLIWKYKFSHTNQ